MVPSFDAIIGMLSALGPWPVPCAPEGRIRQLWPISNVKNFRSRAQLFRLHNDRGHSYGITGLF